MKNKTKLTEKELEEKEEKGKERRRGKSRMDVREEERKRNTLGTEDVDIDGSYTSASSIFNLNYSVSQLDLKNLNDDF